MNKLMSSICATAVLATSVVVSPAVAGAGAGIGLTEQSGYTLAQYDLNTAAPNVNSPWFPSTQPRFRDREVRRDVVNRRHADRHPHYRGHRGYRDYRPGYRRHNGFWFPAAAFITGAIVGGAIAGDSGVRVRNYGSAHVNWCSDRYRSYRASDNTFQPYNGPRRTCVSPYS